LTGEYPWRRQGTGIAPGNAKAIITPERVTLASMLQKSGYKTAAVGKWHLGLGTEQGVDWNNSIKPGPCEIGFDYCFIMPATGDRVPCVYVENDRIVNLDPNDPIEVKYNEKFGNLPTGREHPELLKMHTTHGHDNTIINGIGRIGFMTGGQSALWNDETIAETLSDKVIHFIKENKNVPFFVYLATHDIHVPRVAHPKFAGQSGHGTRGDVILQLDDTVGKIIDTLKELRIFENTLIIFTSDNGPIVDDGYKDGSMENIGNHQPAGHFRGSKYSKFEAGTRVPFIVQWQQRIKPDISNAAVSQIDLFASLASIIGQKIPAGTAPDSIDSSATLIGESAIGRDFVIEHGNGLALISRNWKYIPPNEKGSRILVAPKMGNNTPVETGNLPEPQLYDLSVDISEQKNIAPEKPEIVKDLNELLESVKKSAKK
jgi:arylsulfatase A-like enzyme